MYGKIYICLQNILHKKMRRLHFVVLAGASSFICTLSKAGVSLSLTLS